MTTPIDIQESCAVAKMTARCALSNWIEWAVAEIWQFEIIQDGGLPPTYFDVTGNSAIRSADPENLPWNQTWSVSDHTLRRYGHSCILGHGNPFGGRGGRRGQRWHHSKERWWFPPIDPENPTLEPNMKCIGSPVAEIWPFAYLGAHGTQFLGEGEVVGVSEGTIRNSDGSFL